MTAPAPRAPVAPATGSRGAGASRPGTRLPWARLPWTRLPWTRLAGGVLLVLAALGAVLLVRSGQHRDADVAADRGAGPVVAVPAVPRVAADPVALVVPSLGLDTRLVGLGTDRAGALQVDEDPQRAGWYVDGPAPGDAGPAVLAGHSDSPAGPGVFAQLDRLRPGDRVEVRRADGTTAAFAVREVTTYAKRDFPTARVYGGAGTATLRLVTCGGRVDPGTGRYRSNTVVFADEVPGTG